MFDPDRSPQNLTLSPSLTVELVTVAQDQDNLSVGNFSSTLTADLRALSENMTRNVTCGDFNTMDTATIPPFIVQCEHTISTSKRNACLLYTLRINSL